MYINLCGARASSKFYCKTIFKNIGLLLPDLGTINLTCKWGDLLVWFSPKPEIFSYKTWSICNFSSHLTKISCWNLQGQITYFLASFRSRYFYLWKFGQKCFLFCFFKIKHSLYPTPKSMFRVYLKVNRYFFLSLFQIS